MPEGLREKIEVRKVTQAHIAWTEGEPSQAGIFTVQLVLDDGADEYVLQRQNHYSTSYGVDEVGAFVRSRFYMIDLI